MIYWGWTLVGDLVGLGCLSGRIKNLVGLQLDLVGDLVGLQLDVVGDLVGDLCCTVIDWAPLV